MSNPTRRSAPYAVAIANGAMSSLSALTRRERLDYGQLPHEARRREWLAGRCAAKRAISAFRGVGTPLHHIELEPRTDAGPRCLVYDHVERWTLAPLVLSIAHADGVAVAAASSHSSRIGIDVEHRGEIPPVHQRYFLAPSEHAHARRLGVTLIWVLKEALWKALGLSQALAFTSVQLAFFHDTDTLAGAWVGGSWIRARARRVHLTDHPELVAAVVSVDEDAE